jgi:hypothetical protein
MLRGVSQGAYHPTRRRTGHLLIHGLFHLWRTTYSIGIRFGIEDLIFHRQGVESWETSLSVLVEEVLLRKYLEPLCGLRIIIQPQGLLFPGNGSWVVDGGIESLVWVCHVVDQQLDLVSEGWCVFLHAADGVSELIPVSISVYSMLFTPPPLRIIQGTVDFVRVDGLLKGRIGTVDPFQRQYSVKYQGFRDSYKCKQNRSLAPPTFPTCQCSTLPRRTTGLPSLPGPHPRLSPRTARG